MNRAKWTWVATLIAIYAALWIWHGGNGDPISEAEGEELLAQLEQAYGVSRDDPPGSGESTNFIRNMVEMIPRDDGREFYAVNLEQLKEGEEARAADQRYGQMVIPLVFAHGGHPVFVGDRAGSMLGDYGADVDRVAVIRYRSLRDMIEMILTPEMQAGSDDKFLSLDHTEVIIVRPFLSFVQMRLIAGALFVILGLAGIALIGFVQKRRASAKPNPAQ